MKLISALFISLLLSLPAHATDQLDITLKNSLSVGQKAPDFTLTETYGQDISLYKQLEKGAVVLSFYRGGWCPICNIQLHAYQQRLHEIEELGAQLIAVSPEMPSYAEITMVKHQLTFKVLSDEGNKIARKYGIIWEVPEDEREAFSVWLKENNNGKTLKDFNHQDSYELPVPATFVIAQDGTAIYAFKDVDYSQRADIEDILTALRTLR